MTDEGISRMMVYGGENKFCMDCDGDECDRIRRVGNGRHVYFQLIQGTSRAIGYFVSQETQNYGKTLLAVCVVGSLIILLCLFDSIQKMVLFVRIAKINKKRKE